MYELREQCCHLKQVEPGELSDHIILFFGISPPPQSSDIVMVFLSLALVYHTLGSLVNSLI